MRCAEQCVNQHGGHCVERFSGCAKDRRTLKTTERRKIVRRKPPVQQRKADMPLCRKADICPDVIQRYCGGGGSGAVSQLGCYRRAAQSAVA